MSQLQEEFLYLLIEEGQDDLYNAAANKETNLLSLDRQNVLSQYGQKVRELREVKINNALLEVTTSGWGGEKRDNPTWGSHFLQWVKLTKYQANKLRRGVAKPTPYSGVEQARSLLYIVNSVIGFQDGLVLTLNSRRRKLKLKMSQL